MGSTSNVMSRMAKPTLYAAAGALTSALLLGSVALATSKASVIHGCYAKKTGALRIQAHGQRCPAGSLALSWNQTGPPGPAVAGTAGPAGPAGAAGPAGSAGPRGPSDVWTSAATNLDLFLPGLANPATVATSAPLPAGSYLLQATVVLNGTGTGTPAAVGCSFDGQPEDSQGSVVAGQDLTLPLLYSVSLTATQPVTISCHQGLFDAVDVASYTLDIAAVSTFH